jgi:phenylpyruvate tautomerase PptA (4-oxalocrotonate tautomerase family)
MPLYTIFAEDGSISDKTKAEIAQEITRIHAEVMKVPKSFVRVVFLSYASGCGYTVGEKARTVAMNCVLRAGHSFARTHYREVTCHGSIPLDVVGNCCATIWHSKGYNTGNILMANRVVESMWRWTKEGALPIVCDASS